MTEGLFTVDYLDGEVLEWYATPDGIETVSNSGYTATIYAVLDGDLSFEDLADRLDPHPLAVDMSFEPWRRGWRHEAEPVLRIDVPDIDAVDELAYFLRDIGRPGTVECFNVDFSCEFRYCLETGQMLAPARDLRMLNLSAPATAMVDDPISKLTMDGERLPAVSRPSTASNGRSLDRLPFDHLPKAAEDWITG